MIKKIYYIALIVICESFSITKKNHKEWNYLNKESNQIIEVIAASCNFGNSRISEFKNEFDEIRIKYNIAKDLFKEGEPFFHSNSLEYRLNHLYRSLLDKNICCIWSISGGRGANEIFLDKKFWLDVKQKLKNSPPKLFIGFSDFTAILLYATEVLNWPAIHGVNLGALFSYDKDTRDLYYKILKGETRELTYVLKCENDIARNCEIKSSIIGGNLITVVRSIGTIRQPKTKNKIIFLENCRTPGDETDELFIQLEIAEIFDEVDAVILGFFGPTLDLEGVELAKNRFIERMTKKGIPVFSSDNFGHGDYNYPLPLNTEATIDKNGVLIVKTNKV